jgi:hypothetical protein
MFTHRARFSRHKFVSQQPTGEFGPLNAIETRSVTLREAHTTAPRSLADDLLLRLHAECVGAGLVPAPFGGPSGIRTHDLLNAIETRSQLRYRPMQRN